jgi:glucose-6-phosphate isomerase
MTNPWNPLHSLHDAAKSRRILDLFAANPQRAAQFSANAGAMRLDYSKTNIDAETKAALIALAKSRGVAEKRAAMFGGDKINDTEGRAVLHVALRAPKGVSITTEGRDVVPQIHAIKARMADFARAVRSGTFKGQGGAITDVVNIGIGGSDLGPVMATLALAPFHDGPRVHYVSNVDGAHISDVLAGLNPATTLVIVASKTFTTIETMTNADTAKAWMAKVVTNPGAQFAAVSTAADKTAAYGIDPERVFGFEDWVGGRYSLWGPIGLALMLAIGPDGFDEFLAGGRDMDDRFLTDAFEDNMAVMLALVGIWHNQICGYTTRAVLPYDQRLLRLPAYLQQLEMESNGKRVAMDGSDLPIHSGPVVWGEPGTNGQHAFYQLIHQGTRVVPCEFLVAKQGHEPDLAHMHLLLVSNCLAQSEALMRGRSLAEATAIMAKKGATGAELDRQARHRVFPGNRPSTTLVYPKLTPFVLGQIIALYEHRVFVEGVILGLNSYDQWGVELGKELALALQPVLEGKVGTEGKDGSTAALVDYLRV